MEKTTISTVAKKAGVSTATVSRVMNKSNLVTEETKEKVVKAIEELNYKPSSLARSLRLQKTKTIGLIVSNILNPFYTSIVRGMEDRANNTEYNIILCNSDEDTQKEIKYIDTLVSKNIDGLIISCTGSKIDYYSHIGKTPIVFLDRRPCYINQSPFGTILVDNIDGSKKAVSHLFENGFTRVGIITGSETQTTGKERLEGYKLAHSKAGKKIDPNLIKVGNFLGSDAYKLAKGLLIDEKVDSIFSTNNRILLGVIQAINELNLQIPTEIGIVTFDEIEWLKYFSPSITSVEQPTNEIGKKAVDLLLEQIHNKNFTGKEIVLEVKLNIRKSSTRQ